MEAESFDSNTQAFIAWLKSIANVDLSPKIKIEDQRQSNQGRCIIASKNISKDEVLFSIPRDSIINIKTATLCKDFPKIEEVLLTEVGHWEGLVLCLVYEWMVIKSESKWWPYFQILPSSQELNGLIYWSDKELEQLKPSLVLERIGKKTAEEMFKNIKSLVKQYEIEPLNSLDYEEFQHVASVIMSYSFDVEIPDPEKDEDEEEEEEEEQEDSGNVKSDGYMKSMIPLADTLNSDTYKCNANLMYDDKALKMCAIKDIKEGEQIFNIYGNHPNSEILRRYGYVEYEGSKFDFGDLLLSNIKEALEKNFNVSLSLIDSILEILQSDHTTLDLLQENIVLDSFDCYADGEILTEAVALLQILTVLCQIPSLKDEQEDALVSTVRRVTKKCIQLLEGGRITAKCNDMWHSAIQIRMKEYDSNVMHTIKQPNTQDISKIRHSMACAVLQSEYKSLQSCEGSLDKQFKFINDEKLLDNILKRKRDSSIEDSNNSKKHKH